MSSAPQEVLSGMKGNDRYFLPLIAAFVLGLLLLFYRDLDPWIQRQFVPSFVVYLVGGALVAQVQQMVGMREELRCKADGRSFIGSPKWFFRGVIGAHVAWFAAWVVYLARAA